MPTLRSLRIVFKKKTFESAIEIDDWKHFIRTKKSLLARCEFCFSYDMLSSNWISLDALTAPFRTTFWLHEKHWFIKCKCLINQPHVISLYTVPNSLPLYHIRGIRCAISSKDNTYYLTTRSNTKKC
ncbi:unnamed protein product [Rotaria sp. Silwood1]|nr:unnamed protein product [Rotaria sp. Silwood1]CAF1601388.1 unnamed protein product [Rotaria sp. Silwood1]CAF3605275.1 unnamed protein product [Rotaria sp. Silwood1]CAF3749330.1 unnamed protein product [Rotaria sp. Silwood1]CAF3754144.1 unnamed protein product [Rotaria sp. Silwood1]